MLTSLALIGASRVCYPLSLIGLDETCEGWESTKYLTFGASCAVALSAICIVFVLVSQSAGIM